MQFRMPWVAVQDAVRNRCNRRDFERRMRGYQPWYAWRPVRLYTDPSFRGPGDPTSRWAWLEIVTRVPWPYRNPWWGRWAHYPRDRDREATSAQRYQEHKEEKAA